jgi:tungstate transport system permease protein
LNYISEGFVQAIGLIFSMNEETWSAVSVTVRLTLLSMTVTLLAGLPLGFLLGYFDFPGRRGVRTIVDTLLALPTVVVGLVVYAFISNRGPLGSWRLLFTVRGMAIGQTILALPIVVALTASAVEGLDKRLRSTLATLGASGWRMALTCLVESRFALLVAAMTAYGRIVAEVGVSMMLGGNIKWHTRTITTAITLETGKGDFALGIALGILLLAISFILNAGLSFLRRRVDA